MLSWLLFAGLYLPYRLSFYSAMPKIVYVKGLAVGYRWRKGKLLVKVKLKCLVAPATQRHEVYLRYGGGVCTIPPFRLQHPCSPTLLSNGYFGGYRNQWAEQWSGTVICCFQGRWTSVVLESIVWETQMKQSRIIEQLLAEQVVYNLTMAHFCMAEIVPLYELHYPKEIKTKFKKQKLLHLFFTSEKNLPSSTLMLLLHYLPSVVHQAQISFW